MLGASKFYIVRETGSAAILAVIAMLLLGTLSAILVTASLSEASIAANHRDGVAAQYLAEAGVQQAIDRLKNGDGANTAQQIFNNSGTNKVKFYSETFNAGTPTQGVYSVTIGAGDMNSERKIISTGTVGNATRQVVVTVESYGIYNYAAFAADKIDIGSGTTLTSIGVEKGQGFSKNSRENGSIGCNKSLTISASGVTINGDVDTVSKVNPVATQANIDVKGKINTGRQMLEMPDITNLSEYYDSNIPLLPSSGTLLGTKYRVDGEQKIDSILKAAGDVTIYVNGSLAVDADMEGNFTIISYGSLAIQSGAKVKALIVNSGSCNIGDGAEVTGCVVAASTQPTDLGLKINSSKIIYDASVVEKSLAQNPKFKVTTALKVKADSWSNK